MARKTNRLQVVFPIVTIRVNVMDCKVVHIALLTLGLESTDCTSVSIAPQHRLAVVKVHVTVLSGVPARGHTNLGVLDGFHVRVKAGFPLIPRRFVIETKDAEAARTMRGSYEALARKKGQAVEVTDGRARFQDPYLRSAPPVTVEAQGRYLLGMFADNAATSVRYLHAVTDSLRQQKLLR